MSPQTIPNLPSTPEAMSLQAYLQAQSTRSFEGSANFFTEDIEFNDLMYPVSGLDAVTKSLQEYVEKYLTTFEVEAVRELATAKQYLVLYKFALQGKSECIYVSEVVSFKEGKICRVENCFDLELMKRLYPE